MPSSAVRDRLGGGQKLIEILLRSEGDRLRRHIRRLEYLLSSPDGGDVDWSPTNGESSFEATPTGQLQRHLSLELAALLRRLCDLSSAKPAPMMSSSSEITDEGGSSTDDLYRHLSRFSRYGLGQRSGEAEERRKPEKRKRPTKTSELDPTFMLMGIGKK